MNPFGARLNPFEKSIENCNREIAFGSLNLGAGLMPK